MVNGKRGKSVSGDYLFCHYLERSGETTRDLDFFALNGNEFHRGLVKSFPVNKLIPSTSFGNFLDGKIIDPRGYAYVLLNEVSRIGDFSDVIIFNPSNKDKLKYRVLNKNIKRID